MSQSSQFDFSAYIADRTRDFVGREWVFAEIDNTRAPHAPPDAPRHDSRGPPHLDATSMHVRKPWMYVANEWDPLIWKLYRHLGPNQTVAFFRDASMHILEVIPVSRSPFALGERGDDTHLRGEQYGH
jgi:hypothetical protein